MSGFFESEVVRNAIKEMEELQQEIIEATFSAPLMTPEQRREHIDLMKTFLEKQKNLYFRLTLSDDPEAQLMKDSIMSSARQLGFPADVDLSYVFSNMTNVIDNMRKHLDESL